MSTDQEEIPHPQTRQKGIVGLLQCPIILLACFRARISALLPIFVLYGRNVNDVDVVGQRPDQMDDDRASIVALPFHFP